MTTATACEIQARQKKEKRYSFQEYLEHFAPEMIDRYNRREDFADRFARALRQKLQSEKHCKQAVQQ